MSTPPAFEGGTTIEKKDIVRRCVGKVIVDREQKAVRCCIRRFPMAGNPADDLIERLEKAKTAPPEGVMPFRNNEVPGTGHVDSAKWTSDPDGSWWIVMEMSL